MHVFVTLRMTARLNGRRTRAHVNLAAPTANDRRAALTGQVDAVLGQVELVSRLISRHRRPPSLALGHRRRAGIDRRVVRAADVNLLRLVDHLLASGCHLH